MNRLKTKYASEKENIYLSDMCTIKIQFISIS